MNVTVCVFPCSVTLPVWSRWSEDLSLDQDEEVQCESVRVHVTLDTVDNSQLVLSQTSTGFEAVVLIAVWISEGLLCLETLKHQLSMDCVKGRVTSLGGVFTIHCTWTLTRLHKFTVRWCCSCTG